MDYLIFSRKKFKTYKNKKNTHQACQNPTKGGDGYNIGTLTTAEFSLSGGNTIISFSASPR